MARVELPGVAKVNKKLADGSIRTYYYAWRGGPLLKNKDGSPAQPHQVSFAVEYAKAWADREATTNETVATLIQEYLNSSEFNSKGDNTRREYERYLANMPDAFKKMKIKEVEKPSVRIHFKKWRDTMADTPRAADYAMGSIARVLSHAKDNGRIKVNILERPGRLSKPDRAEKIWTDDHLDNIQEHAPPHVMLPVWIALNTAQRRGDVVKLMWSQYDGECLKIKQGKKKAYVRIPVFGFLKDMLDDLERTSTHICTNSRGRPWTPDGLNSSLDKARKRAGISDVTFHDLRGTAVVHLARADCTVPEIASYTGHSLDDVNDILDAHYLGARAKLAESAGEKLKAYQLKQL